VMRYLSPSVERILGYSRTELVGHRAFDFIHPDDLEAVVRTFTEAVATPGALRTLEYRFRHKDGSWRYLEGIGRNLLDDPLIKAVVVNARDVMERKQAEENERTLLRELQSALAEVRTLRGLIRICSHCKRVLTDDGAWQQFESYVRDHSEVEFSHGICPECAAAWSATVPEGPP
jgi:PAS domain S-box-containing protein